MSNKYWDNREVKLRKHLLDISIKSTEAELLIQYNKSAKKIIAYMEKLYTEIMSNPDVLASHIYQYNRYYEMIQTIETELKRLNGKEVSLLNKDFEKLYNNNVKIMRSSFPMLSKVDTKSAVDIINQYWVGDGMNWSDRVWKDKTLLIDKLKSGMIDSIALGRKSDDLVKELMKDFGQSYNNARRLVRTEMAHIQTLSTLLKYIEAGLTEYRVLTAGDDRVCLDCKDIENKPLSIAAALTGVNLPPLHPFVDAPFLALLIVPWMVRIKNNFGGNLIWKKSGETVKIMRAYIRYQIMEELGVLKEILICLMA